jgi:hypothetical protein
VSPTAACDRPAQTLLSVPVLGTPYALVPPIMRRLGIALITLTALIGAAAYGQQQATVTPSQTPPHPVLQIIPDDASVNRLEVEVGAVRLTTHSGRYTFAYLPLLAPLQSTAFRPSIEMPNGLALTGTSIPQRPRTDARARVDIR